MQVTLASKSPRRRQLIAKIPFLEVKIVVSNEEEKSIFTRPEELTIDLAKQKATAVRKIVGGVVIGADTVVSVDGKILGKPKSEEEAKAFFRQLCGRSHEVYTGIAVISDKREETVAVKTEVIFNDYDSDIVDEYVKSGAPFDKAGGYGIQDEKLAPLIAGVKGDLDNVIGLPVSALKTILEEKFK